MAVPAIESVAARRVSEKVFQSNDVRGGEVADMDIIANACAVLGFKVGAEHANMAAFAQCRFNRDFDKVRCPSGRLPRAPCGSAPATLK